MHVFLFLESSRATYRDIWHKSSEFQIPHCHILKMNENESTQNQSEVHDPEGALMEVKKNLKKILEETLTTSSTRVCLIKLKNVPGPTWVI